MEDEMRQRRVRISEMGEPVPSRTVESKISRGKPTTEWTKAIIMSITIMPGFVMFALRKKATYLARKTSDFRNYDKCKLETYPIWKIDEIKELNLSRCKNVSLPDDIELWSRFKSLKKIDLNNNSLENLPAAMDAVSSSLEILFLSENHFSEVPDVIKGMKKLRVLSLRGNSLAELSSEKLPVSSLVWLILTNNNITKINKEVNELKLLRKLMLSHNQLNEVPVELGECRDLELVRLADNNIQKMPAEVLMLPKLGWISLSGNPIFQVKRPNNGENIIKEQDIDINKANILGQGASGVVYSGIYQGADVAVKVFKEQSKGSDGNAEDEMIINNIVNHPYTISAMGVVQKGDKKEMMVMQLLKGTNPLGKVPSFDTVTRDAGPAPLPKNTMDKETLMRAILNIASTLEHIHGHVGVSHGDVYLHNVLIDGEKVSRLSDWGASFLYDRDNEQAQLIERIEVLAFGRLIQDLLLWYPKALREESFKELLADILQPETANRPSFKIIKEKLALIENA